MLQLLEHLLLVLDAMTIFACSCEQVERIRTTKEEATAELLSTFLDPYMEPPFEFEEATYRRFADLVCKAFITTLTNASYSKSSIDAKTSRFIERAARYEVVKFDDNGHVWPKMSFYWNGTWKDGHSVHPPRAEPPTKGRWYNLLFRNAIPKGPVFYRGPVTRKMAAVANYARKYGLKDPHTVDVILAEGSFFEEQSYALVWWLLQQSIDPDNAV